MKNVLFLLCPTDVLESKIRQFYPQGVYFVTFLGNAFAVNSRLFAPVKKLIEKHDIQEIYIVLSIDNPIIKDAMEGHFYTNIKGLKRFYKQLQHQKKASEKTWKSGFDKFYTLSYHINQKIIELKQELNRLPNPPKIKGKIYKRDQDSFTDIYPNLLCLDRPVLN